MNNKKARLLLNKTAWRPRSRKVHLDAIAREDGSAARSPAEAGDLLFAHWSPIFTDVPQDPLCVDELRQHVPLAPPDIRWKITLDEFGSIVNSRRNATPGLDGIPALAYKILGDIAIETLFHLYAFILCNGVCYDGFNHSLMVFLPKDGDVDEQGAFFCYAPLESQQRRQ